MKSILTLIALLMATSLSAQVADSLKVDSLGEQALQEVTVTASRTGRTRLSAVGNTEMISSKELLRAACCNLGESFTTNPSVDVNYADAATGAQQIKLLGLSGTYVQMLTENIPNYRGVAAPYALGYIPGPWMQSIQVSKGASSVKNGYESITGQINVEFKKPQATPFADANLYFNSDQKLEANLGANLKLSERWSTALLGHYELLDMAHDDNGDGFADMPKMRQGSLMGRWAYLSDNYIFQASVKGLKEHREGGQVSEKGIVKSEKFATATISPYLIDITNERYEAFAKNAFILNPEHGTNIALILSGSIHHARSLYGQKRYDADERNGYASLLFETDFDDHHSLSTGLSLNHDYSLTPDPSPKERGVYSSSAEKPDSKSDYSPLLGRGAGGEAESDYSPLLGRGAGGEAETTPGAYAQYTYKIGEKLTLMGGLRWDYSSLWGAFVTPRMHVKYSVGGDLQSPTLTLRGSVGKGYRTPHILAENSYLLASNRQLIIGNASSTNAQTTNFPNDQTTTPLNDQTTNSPNAQTPNTPNAQTSIGQEQAWNYGLSAAFRIPLGQRTLELNAEYYYTHFTQQAIIDYDMSPQMLCVHGMKDGDKSRSHTFQIDATCEVIPQLNVTAAWRFNDVKATYGGQLREKPMNSRYKGLLTASYAPGLGKWQLDATLQLNGGGRMPYFIDHSTLNIDHSTLNIDHSTLNIDHSPSSGSTANNVQWSMDNGQWTTAFPAYEQLSIQVTRFFRHWSIYAGGENLTNFKQKNAIISADNPWSKDFDATMIWGPVHGTVWYIGFRLNWNKM